jgi:hypothetical protein
VTLPVEGLHALSRREHDVSPDSNTLPQIVPD